MRTYFIRCLVLLSALIAARAAFSDVIDSGRGILFGDDHAFAATAPAGWVLDNESGVAQGVYMTFYPKEFTWKNSPVIVYGNVSHWSSTLTSAQQQVESTVAEFHSNGSPNYRARAGKSISLPDGKQVPIYYFQGDKWGNYEAGAYFHEKRTLNFLIYSARDKMHFEQYWPQFVSLVKSYENLFARIHALDHAQYTAMWKAANKVSKTVAGDKYERRDTAAQGNGYASAMRQCAGFLKDDSLENFHLLEQVMPDGTAGKLYVYPRNATAICFAGYLLTVRHLPHTFMPYYPLVIDMRIKP